MTFVMMLHITVNAVLRTVADEPLPNTLEYVQYWYLPAVAFLGFIAAQRRGQHMAADLIYTRLPKAAQRVVLPVMLLMSSVLSAGFAWFGWDEATARVRHPEDRRRQRRAGVAGVLPGAAGVRQPDRAVRRRGGACRPHTAAGPAGGGPS